MERFVPIWMKTLPTSAAQNASGRNTSSAPASAVPTSTGAIAAGSVRGRAAISPDAQRNRVAGHVRRLYGRRGNFEKSGSRFSR